MKVLILGPDAHSVFRFRRDLAAGMRALGHRVTLAAPPTQDQALLSAIRKAKMTFEPLALDRAGLDPFRDLRFFLSLKDLFSRVGPDLLFLTTIKPMLYGSLAARLWHQGPCFSMLAGAGSLFMGSSPLRVAARILTLPFLKLGLSRNQAVLFQNPDDRELFSRLGLVDPARTVLVAGSGVDLSEYPFRAVPQGPPKFLFVGRFLKEKGLGDLAQATVLLKRRYPKVRFQALGGLDPNPGSVSERDLSAWRGEGALEFPGAVADVRPLLARSTVFVLPSYYREGVPRSTLEALSTGRAVITCDTPGCRETVVEGKNGLLVPPRDPAALAAAMERFILEPSLARRMSRASRRLAESKFDVRKVNRTILSALFGPSPRRSSRLG